MKQYAPFVLFFLALLAFFGCNTPPVQTQQATTPDSKPSVRIVSAKLDHNKIKVTAEALNLGSKEYELNFGLSFIPIGMPMQDRAKNPYSILEKRIVTAAHSVQTVILDPESKMLHGTYAGTVNVNLSEIPHGPRWTPIASDKTELIIP